MDGSFCMQIMPLLCYTGQADTTAHMLWTKQRYCGSTPARTKSGKEVMDDGTPVCPFPTGGGRFKSTA